MYDMVRLFLWNNIFEKYSYNTCDLNSNGSDHSTKHTDVTYLELSHICMSQFIKPNPPKGLFPFRYYRLLYVAIFFRNFCGALRAVEFARAASWNLQARRVSSVWTLDHGFIPGLDYENKQPSQKLGLIRFQVQLWHWPLIAHCTPSVVFERFQRLLKKERNK